MRLVIGGGVWLAAGRESNWALPLAAHILGWEGGRRGTRGRGAPVSIKVRRDKKEGSAERRRTGSADDVRWFAIGLPQPEGQGAGGRLDGASRRGPCPPEGSLAGQPV